MCWISTATSTGTVGGPAVPPPGFDAQKAKQTPPKHEIATRASRISNLTSRPNASDAVKSASPPGEAQTLAALALDRAVSETTAVTPSSEKQLATKKEEKKKLSIGQKIMKEVHHYWDGTKLLATEIKISVRLAVKMAAGYELSRREHRQVWLIL